MQANVFMPFELALVAVAGLLILAIMSAFLSGIETALFSIKDWRLHRWRKQDPKGVEQYERLMKKPREVLSVILLVDTFVNIVLIVLAVAIASSIAIPFPYWVKILFLFALIVIVSDSLTNEEVIQQLRTKRRARVPVFGESPDEILGILDVKSFLADPSEHYAEKVGVPSFVPETMRALDLLRAFLKHPQRLAIVIDEFGGTEGVVTLGDILDEILAEVAPRGDEELYLEELGNGAWLASGSVRLDDLEEALHIDFHTEEFDTLNGLIFNRLGYVPRSGETVQVPPL